MQRLLLFVWLSIALPCGAAWGSLNTLGSNNNKVSGTNNLVITTTAAAEVNNVILVAVAGDNLCTVDGNTTEHSISDSAGNTYTRALEFCNAQGGAATGATSSIFFSKVTTQLANGGTITLTTSSAITAKGMTAWELSIVSTNVVTVSGTAQIADDALDPSSLTISGLTNGEYLFVRCTAHEGPNTDAYTKDANYTAMDANGTTGGGAATNMSVRGEFRILTATTDSNNPTWTAVDHASTYVALLESAPPAGPPIGTLPLLGAGR